MVSTPEQLLAEQARWAEDDDAWSGSELLDSLRRALGRYVIMPSAEAGDAVTLWIAATHAQPAWQHATRLVITAPEKRCGKSRLLDVIEATCHKPLITVNISPAALVRSIGDEPPTLLLDEADTVFGKKAADNHEDLRGILNAGHQRNRPYIRWDATTRRPEHCPTFSMAALAGIGSMPDTIEDRSVMVRMRRRGPGEKVQPFRTRRDSPPLHGLRDRITAWLHEHLDELSDVEPEMPVEDRAADNWEPLIAVADLAGGQWPERARKACRVLTNAAEEDTSVGVRLLADLREVFEGADADALHGATILERLHKLDEAPWADWYGHPLNARDLAKLLKPYGVASVQVKVDGVGLKGYRREHLYDAWSRYLVRPQEGSETSGTSVTPLVNGAAPVSGFGSRTKPETGITPLTSGVTQVSQVSDTPCCAGCGEPMTILGPGQLWHYRDEDCERLYLERQKEGTP